MRFHAERPGFEFQARSINTVPTGFFNEFFLFLDEFVGNDTGLYLRNLARVSNLRCLVSNTNTRIANLTMGLASGGDGPTLWSLVINRLNTPEAFSDIYQLNEASDRIIQLSGNDQRIGHFLNNFKVHQAKHLRPGMSNFTRNAFIKFANSIQIEDRQFTIRDFLDFVLDDLLSQLIRRKPGLPTEIAAQWAKISLLFPTSYSILTTPALTQIQRFMHQPSFLEKHLYQLANPSYPQDWLFMTFTGTGTNYNLLLYPGANQQWTNQLTYFNPDELLTILSCLAVPFSKPVTVILKEAVRTSRLAASAVGEIDNPQAFKLPGNALEISSLVSIVDSTHHFFDLENWRIINTFAGQNGTNFIKNLVINLIDHPNFFKTSPIFFQFPRENFDLENDFLVHCHMPYIYGVDRRIGQLDDMSNRISSVYFGIIERTRDSEQIDSKFTMRFRLNPSIVTAECKNYQRKLDAGKLEKIITKAVQIHDSKLCLVFCRNFSDEIRIRSRLVRTCSEFSVNVYRVKLDESVDEVRKFIFEPFGRLFPIKKDPSRICIVFESQRINPSNLT